MPFDFQTQIEKASVLLEALPYFQQFRGKTFLIKIGGSAMDDRKLVSALLRDIVFLEIAGINPVLVHGGGKAISAAMENAGLEAVFAGGLRVTTDEAMEIVEKTLGSEINPRLVDSIVELGGAALGVPGNEVFTGQRITGWSDADSKKVSLGRVGKVTSFSLGKINEAVAQNTVPVVSPIAAEEGAGLSLNVNADLAASALAAEMKAAKLVFVSDVLGVMQDPARPETLVHTIPAAEVESLIDDKTIQGGMIPKLRSSVEALQAGVEKVHLVDGRVSHSLLLEIFTTRGIGTEIIQ